MEKGLFQNPRFWFGFLIITFIGMWGSGAGLHNAFVPAQKVHNADNPQELSVENIKNRTTSFNVVGVERTSDRHITLSLRNDFDKTITAFDLAVGTLKIQCDIVEENQMIRPGDIHKFIIPVANLDNSSGKGRSGIVILAVVFEDKTGEGDPKSIKEIEEHRLGERTQLENIIPMLIKALATSDDNPPEELDRMKALVISLPEEFPGNRSWAFKVGMHSAKEAMVREIEETQQAPHWHEQVNLRSEVKRIKEAGMKRTAQL